MNNKHILITDDEPLTRKSLYEILKFDGYKVSTASDGQQALELIAKDPPDIVITDLKMPKIDGLSLLRKIKERKLDISVVLMTAYGSIESAVEAMKEGAFDYVTKPILDNEIKIVIERIFKQREILDENKILKKKLANNMRSKFHNLIGQNYLMLKIYKIIEVVASTNAAVLIQGESGTGKRLVAQALHQSDTTRRDKPFIEVSCGALSENLLESELFGHAKGSFTSAIRDREGRFQAADGGTIFLDEIDTFSPALQVKLLRVLQEGEFERVGDTKTSKVDVRIIAATNQNLNKCIKERTFRSDLYYRLNVIPIFLPPLRERKDDIPLLVEHFLSIFLEKLNYKKKVKGVSKEAMDIIMSHDWQGNVRELGNIIERAVIFCKGDYITDTDLAEFFNEAGLNKIRVNEKKRLLLKEAIKLSEKEIIEDALEEHKGNRKKAADSLGINRTTLYNKMNKYDLLKE